MSRCPKESLRPLTQHERQALQRIVRSGSERADVVARVFLNNPWRMSPAAIAPSVKVGLSDCFEAQNGHSSMEPAKSRHRGG